MANREEAQYILTHPLVVSALSEMDSALNEALSAIPERDTEGMKNLVLMKKCVKKFKQALESHINTGKIDESFIQRDLPPWRALLEKMK